MLCYAMLCNPLSAINLIGGQRLQQEMHIHGLYDDQSGSLDGTVENTLSATNPIDKTTGAFQIKGTGGRICQQTVGIDEHDFARLQNLLDDGSGGAQKGRSAALNLLANEALE